MSAQESGAPVRVSAAPETDLRQEADPKPQFTGPGGRTERIPADHAQYVLRFDTTLSTAQRFEIFHQRNQHVYRQLVDLAREWKIATSGQKLGMRCLWEQLRWQLAITTTSVDYKLNDHYPPYYARLIEHQEPDLRGLFELRKSAEADAWIKRVTA